MYLYQYKILSKTQYFSLEIKQFHVFPAKLPIEIRNIDSILVGIICSVTWSHGQLLRVRKRSLRVK